MDNLVLRTRYKAHAFSVTYSFGDDVLLVQRTDVQGEVMALLIPQPRRRLLLCMQQGSTLARRVINITTSYIRDHLGILNFPIGPKCVLFQAAVTEDDSAAFKRLVESKELQNQLQRVFLEIEDHLRKELGKEFQKIDSSLIEDLKKVKVVSAELYDEETLKSDWEHETLTSAASQRDMLTRDKISAIFDGNISDAKLTTVENKFKELGVRRQTDLAILVESDISLEFENTPLNLVELRKLTMFVKGHTIPLPPTNLRIAVSGRHSDTTLIVIFDDPNKMACEYLITAQDVQSQEIVQIPSDINYGVLRNLKPGKKYVVFAQCTSNGFKSKSSIWDAPFEIYQRETDGYKIPDEEREKLASDIVKDEQSIPDSGVLTISEDNMSTVSGQLTEEGGSTAEKSIEGKIVPGTREGRGRLSEISVLRELQDIFPTMDKSSMENLLKKCVDIGIEHKRDFKYFKEPEVAEELKGTLKIVEVKKLLQHVNEETSRNKFNYSNIYVNRTLAKKGDY